MDIDDIPNLIERGEYQKALGLINEIPDPSIDLIILSSEIFRDLGNYQKSLDLAREAVEKSLKSTNSYIHSLALLHEAYALWFLGDFDSAKTSIETAERELDLIDDIDLKTKDLTKAQILHVKGNIFLRLGDDDKALECFLFGLEVREKHNYLRGMVNSSNNIAYMYRSKGNYNVAREYYLKSLKYAKEIDNPRDISWIDINVGEIYYYLGDLDTALQFYHESIKLMDSIENVNRSLYPFEYMANIYIAQGDLPKAFEYQSKDLENFKELGNLVNIAKSMFNMINICLLSDNLKDAKSVLDELHEIYMKVDNDFVKVYYNLSNALMYRFENRLNSLLKAEEIIDDIIKQPVLEFSLTKFALYQKCELLMKQLILDPSPEIILETRELIDHLYSLSDTHSTILGRVETLILQSKFNLVIGNFVSALDSLEIAYKLAEEAGLISLSNRAKVEIEKLNNDTDKWANLLLVQSNFKERFELSEITKYLSEISKFVDTISG